MGDKKIVDTMIRDGLWDANNYHIYYQAENINKISGASPAVSRTSSGRAASQQKTGGCLQPPAASTTVIVPPVPVKVGRRTWSSLNEFLPGRRRLDIAALRGAFVGPESPTEVVHTFGGHRRCHGDRGTRATKRVTAATFSGIDGAAPSAAR